MYLACVYVCEVCVTHVMYVTCVYACVVCARM